MKRHAPLGTDAPFLRQQLWFGITRWTWVRLAYLVVVAMAALGLFLVQRQARNIDVESEKRTFAICESQNQTKKAILDIVEFTYSRGAAVPPPPEVARARQEFIDYVRAVTQPAECPPK